MWYLVHKKRATEVAVFNQNIPTMSRSLYRVYVIILDINEKENEGMSKTQVAEMIATAQSNEDETF